MGLKQMLALAQAGIKLDNIQLVTQTMPGWFLDEHGVSYWYVDPQRAKEVARSLFEEGKVMEVVQGVITDNEPKQVAAEQTPPPEQGWNNNSGTAANQTTNITDNIIPDDIEFTPGGEEHASGGEDGEYYIPTIPGESVQEETVNSEHVEVIINTFP